MPQAFTLRLLRPLKVGMLSQVLFSSPLAFAQLPAPQTTEAKASVTAPPAVVESPSAEVATSSEEKSQASKEKADAAEESSPAEGQSPAAEGQSPAVESKAQEQKATKAASLASLDAAQEVKKEEAQSTSPSKEKVEKKKVKAEPAMDPNLLPFTYHQKHVDVQLGLQLNGAASDGLEPFLDKSAMGKVFLRAGSSVYSRGKMTLAVLADAGTTKVGSSARGTETNLRLVSLGLALEARYHLHHRLYVYGRVAPGAEGAFAELGDAFSELVRKDSNWGFAVDSSVGAAMRLAGNSDGRVRALRFWTFVEGGFRYASGHELLLEAHEDSTPARAVPIALNSFNSTGVLFTGGLGVSF